MKYIIIFITALAILLPSNSTAQMEKVRNYLNMVALGKIDDVKKALPDLLAEYPDDPGVQFLHATVIEDGVRALDMYREIVKNFPYCEWADDSYWRIVQFYAIIGDTAQAILELQNYRKKYPTSEFLIAATDVVQTAMRVAGKNIDTRKLWKDSENNSKPAKEENSENVLKKPEPEENYSAADTKGKFGLQVGIYSSYEAARSEMQKFREQRLLADVMPKKIEGEIMYAVIIGNYSTKESAESAKAIIQQQCKCVPLVFQK